MKRTNIINLTPHTINIVSRNGITVDIPSTGLARVKTSKLVCGIVNGITLYAESYGDIEGLPEPRENTIYVVSRPVAQALADPRYTGEKRTDVYVPGELIRDEDGRPIGCKGLSCL